MNTEKVEQKQKPFFHLGNPKVEYSTDFEFFLKNQIWTIHNNTGYPTTTFCSLIESKTFERVKNVLHFKKLSEQEVIEKCREIHNNLMVGKYGTPTFVD